MLNVIDFDATLSPEFLQQRIVSLRRVSLNIGRGGGLPDPLIAPY